MVGLSVAATLLAVVLVVGLLAWVRRDLQARGASVRAWWLVVGCYAFAALVWLVAITVPLPVMIAWLATIPAAVATVSPERLAATLGGLGRSRPQRQRRRPRSVAHASGPRHPMAHPIDAPKAAATAATGTARRRATTRPSTTSRATPTPPQRSTQRPPEATMPAGSATGAIPAATATPPSVPAIGRHRWHPGDLRLAVELLEDASRLPNLDDAARDRIDSRLDRLDRFRDASTTELLALVREDVRARLASGTPSVEPDTARTQRIGQLLDELDPGPSGTGS